MNIKALLLSALVLPGLGQIVKGERVKGLVIIAAVTILLLASLFVILPLLGKVLLVRGTGGGDLTPLLRAIDSATPVGRVLLALLAVIWGYAVIDAGVSRTK